MTEIIKIPKFYSTDCGLNCEETGTQMYLLVCKAMPALERIWLHQFKLQMHLPLDLAIPLLGIYPTNMTVYVQNGEYKRLLITAVFVIRGDWKLPMFLLNVSGNCPVMGDC